MRATLSSLLLSLSACGGLVDDWQPVSYVDEGQVCFEADGADIVAQVVVQDCMSGSCTRNFVGSCSATASGSEITLTSDISWEENVGAVACTDDCGIPMATCVLEGLADGTYDVTFGGEQLQLVVPVTEPCSIY